MEESVRTAQALHQRNSSDAPYKRGRKNARNRAPGQGQPAHTETHRHTYTQPGAQPLPCPGPACPWTGPRVHVRLQGRAYGEGTPMGTYAKKKLLPPPASLLLNPKPRGRICTHMRNITRSRAPGEGQHTSAGAYHNKHTRARNRALGEGQPRSAGVHKHTASCPWRGRAYQDMRKEKLIPPPASLLPTDDNDDGAPLKTGARYPHP